MPDIDARETTITGRGLIIAFVKREEGIGDAHARRRRITLRHHVQYVVTEHGVANLGMLSTRERAEALTAIADPAFRAEQRGA